MEPYPFGHGYSWVKVFRQHFFFCPQNADSGRLKHFMNLCQIRRIVLVKNKISKSGKVSFSKQNDLTFQFEMTFHFELCFGCI